MLILKIAHTDLDFQWKDKSWLMEGGIPIGSPCGPTLAVLAVQDTTMGTTAVEEFLKTLCWYYDDVIGVSATHPEQFMRRLLPTREQPNLKFEAC